MVGAPAGLYYLFGLAMLLVSAYGVALLAASALERRVGGRDVELSHAVMGVAMAGMFIPGWSFGPSVMWQLIFAAFLVWFVIRSVQSILAWGLHAPHTAIHAVMSFAMLLMYWFPRGASAHAMSMALARSGAHIDPGPAFLIAFILFGSAVFTVASPNRGATHYGTHCGASGPVRASDTWSAETAAVPLGVAGFIGAPSLLDASHIVMCVGMGLMLILML